MLKLFYSKIKACDKIDALDDEVEGDHLRKCISDLWKQLIEIRHNEDTLLNRITSLEDDVAVVKPGGEAEKLIKESIANLRLELVNITKPSKEIDGQTTIYDEIIKRIDNHARDLIRFEIKTVAAYAIKEFTIKLTEYTSSIINMVDNLVNIRDKAISDSQHITQELVKKLFFILEQDTSTMYVEENVEDVVDKFAEDLVQELLKTKQYMEEYIAGQKYQKQIKHLVLSLEKYVGKLKMQTLNRSEDFDESAIAAKQKDYSMSHLEKIIKICKDVVNSGTIISPELDHFLLSYDKKIESLYFHKEHSYTALLLLESTLKSATTDTIKQITELEIIICKLQIHKQELIIELSKAKIYDLLHDSKNHVHALPAALKEIILPIKYLERLKVMLAKTEEIANGQSLIKDQSILLLYALQTFFLQCDFNDKMKVEKFPKEMKKRLSNLIANYKKFHRYYYLPDDDLKDKFIIPSDLFAEICSVNLLFESATIVNLDYIIKHCSPINSLSASASLPQLPRLQLSCS